MHWHIHRYIYPVAQPWLVTVFCKSSTLHKEKSVCQLFCGTQTMQMLMLAPGEGSIKHRGQHQKIQPCCWPISTKSQWAHLCSSNRPDHWDIYAINTGNEKKVSHATFQRPQHSHILTGLRMKSNTWHPFPSNSKTPSCRVKSLSYFIWEERSRVTSSQSS